MLFLVISLECQLRVCESKLAGGMVLAEAKHESRELEWSVPAPIWLVVIAGFAVAGHWRGGAVSICARRVA